MDTPEHPGSGETRFIGTTTGQVQVGRFILDVPSPGGTTLSLAPRRARTDPPPELLAALAQHSPDPPGEPAASSTPDGPAEPDFADKANQLLDTAEDVTDKIEHVTDTVQAILSGRVPDPELISGDLLELLELMKRLAQAGRFAEVIKLGRPLCRLFALTLRWAALVESLRLVFHAATALADTPTTAWTQHELGTLHGSVGDIDRARKLLEQARRSRKEIGDERGLKATEHNLKVLSARGAIITSTAAMVGVGVVVLIVAVLVFTETVGGGTSHGSVTTSDTASTTRTSSTVASRSSSTPSRTSSSTSSHSTSVQVNSSGTPATAPTALTRPPAAKFEPTTIGQSASTDIHLVNGGPGALHVTSAQISGGSEFTIAPDGCSGQDVSAGALCTVTVDFTPAAEGPASATLTFTDNADPPAQQVPLAATGQAQTTSNPGTGTVTGRGTGTTTLTSPSSGTATQPPPAQ